MGIRAKWTATCDGCGQVQVMELNFGDDIPENYGEDAFGPGLPWVAEEYRSWCYEEEAPFRVFCGYECSLKK